MNNLMNSKRLLALLLIFSVALSVSAQIQNREQLNSPILHRTAYKQEYYNRGLNPQNIPNRIPIIKENPADSVSNSPEEELITLGAELETWYVNWLSVSYLGDNAISPTYILSPSLSLRYKKFRATISYQFGASTRSFIAGLETFDKPATLGLEAIHTDIMYIKDKPLFRTKIQIGKFKGISLYDFIADTIRWEWKSDTVKIKTTSLSIDFLWRGYMSKITGLNYFIGLKYIDYKAPLLVRGEEIPDPRDRSYSIVFTDMPQTHIRHFFLILDVFDDHYKKQSPKTDERRFAVNLQGHFRMLLLGLGYAKNNVLGTVPTFSFNSIFGNPEEVKALDYFNDFDIDLGVSLRYKLGMHSTFKFAVGAHWFSWQIRSFIKTIDGDKRQLFSTEAYFGPYAQIILTL